MANANLTQKGELQTSFCAGQVKERGGIKKRASGGRVSKESSISITAAKKTNELTCGDNGSLCRTVSK